MLVDAVNAVVEIAAADIEPAPSFGTRIRPDFIAGMGKYNGRFVILLDIERVLSSEEIVDMARGTVSRRGLRVASMAVAMITDREFVQFQRFIYDAAGITMANGKQALVSGRLAKRLAHYQLNSYGDYLKLLESRANRPSCSGGRPADHQRDLLLPRTQALCTAARSGRKARDKNRALRVWSAASSSGEEPYSIAMVLADVLGDGGMGSAGHRHQHARAAARAAATIRWSAPSHAAGLPEALLPQGQGSEAGTMLIERLRQRVQFQHLNLNRRCPNWARSM
jgi:chemotaxis protein methyltransferase CheR